MRKTPNLDLPIYDKPSTDTFKVADWNKANENIDYVFGELKKNPNVNAIDIKAREDIINNHREVNSQLDSIEQKTPISITDFGAIGDYNLETQTGTDNTKAISDAINEVNRIGGKLIIPYGDYKIIGEINFPKNCEFLGKISVGTVKFSQIKNGTINNIWCDSLILSGLWWSDITIKECPNVIIDGNADWFGTYWNKISINKGSIFNINITKGSVNQNHFYGGRCGTVSITGDNSIIPEAECHNNVFYNFDVSDGGFIQTDSKMQSNTIIGVYAENNKGRDFILGNWNVLSSHGERIPNVNINNHILFTNDSAWTSNSRDFLSLSIENQIEGGDWDILNNKGYGNGVIPVNCTEEVITLADNIYSEKILKLTSNNSWANCSFKLGANLHGGAITFICKGTTKTLEFVRDNNSGISASAVITELKNGYKLYRVCVPQNESLKLFRIYITTSSNEINEFYLCGINATNYKTGLLPKRKSTTICKGIVPSVPTKGIWKVGEFVTNATPTNNIFGWMCVSNDPLQFKAIPLQTQ